MTLRQFKVTAVWLVVVLSLMTGWSTTSVAMAGPGEDGPGEHHADGEDHHDDGHGDHHYYTEDADNDGIPNWRDATLGEAPNEHFALGPVLWHLANFVILFGGLGYVLRRPIGDLLRDRALAIQTEIRNSAESRTAAREQYDEVMVRLDAVSEAVAAIRKDAEDDATAEEARLVAAAEREAERLGAATQRNIRDEVARARQELRQEAVELAVELAEGLLRGRIKKGDQKRLAREFLDSVSDEGANGHV